MHGKTRILALAISLAAVAGVGTALVAAATPSAVSASPSCPNVGTGVGCAYVVTVNPNGSVSISPGPNTTGIDANGHGEGDDVMVGVLNNSSAVVTSVTLSGTGRDDIFGFDGDGICTDTFSPASAGNYCATNGANGSPSYATRSGKKVVGSGGKDPYDYAGPNNTFTGISQNHNVGTVKFTTPLLPQASTFLSLETPPIVKSPAVSATGTATFTPGLVVNAPSVSGAAEGQLFNGAVTTFTDTGSIAPASEFAATVAWGDGSTSSTTDGLGDVTVTGSAGSYTVSGSHTYADEGTFSPAWVTVTDSLLAVNSATSNSASVIVADAPLTPGAPVSIPPQETNVAFTLPVASFTDGNTAASTPSDFSNAGTTIAWGDGTTNTAADGTGDVTITGSGSGGFTVTGTHSYTQATTTAASTAVIVTITDVGGSTTSVTDNAVVVADSVTNCSGSCTGNLQPTTSNPVAAQVSTSNPVTGALLVSAQPTSAQVLNCHDGFEHSPSVLSESNTFGNGATGTIISTVRFPVADGVVLNPGAPGASTPESFWVCFQDNNPFTDITGTSVTTGLLPMCNPFAVGSGPCVNNISTAPDPVSGVLTVTETITYPVADATANDPKRM